MMRSVDALLLLSYSLEILLQHDYRAEMALSEQLEKVLAQYPELSSAERQRILQIPHLLSRNLEPLARVREVYEELLSRIAQLDKIAQFQSSAVVTELRYPLEYIQEDLQKKFRRLTMSIDGLRRSIDVKSQTLLDYSRDLSLDTLELIWGAALGLHPKELSTISHIPVRIFCTCEDKSAQEALKTCVTLIAQSTGFDGVVEDSDIEGSWLKRFFLKIKGWVTWEDLYGVLNEIKTAVEAKYIDKPLAEITLAHAEAVKSLLGAINNIEGSIVMQVGVILLIKENSSFQIWSLPRRRLAELEQNQHLLRDPAALARWANQPGRAPGSDERPPS